jgi:GTP cyclohydrolase IA
MDKEKVEKKFGEIMEEGLDLDLTNPNLKDTPKRWAKMIVDEKLVNCDSEFTDFALFPNDKGYNQMIWCDKIHFVSMCSHHFVDFVGKAWIFYIPDKFFVGASKMARLVQHYAKRPQLQEELSQQVLNQFVAWVKPKGAMVLMRAIHGCMAHRGANQYAGSALGSSALHGIFFTQPELELKALEIVKISLLDRQGE